MSAINRYDGPCFRVLRRYLRNAPVNPPAVWILSAELGLIASTRRVTDYDRTMTAARAESLRSQVEAAFDEIRRESPFTDAFVCLGVNYARTMSECWTSLPTRVTVRHSHGAIGGRTSQLGEWLHGAHAFVDREGLQSPAGQARLRGVTVAFTPDAVMSIARERLVSDPVGAGRFQTRCVRVGEHRIAPKWLVSQLTGIPVGRFRTSDAARVLAALGVRVERT